VTPYIPQLFENSLYLIAYDPNYLYDDNEDEEMEDDGEGWGSDFEDEDQERADDDDDTSWKVRRGAIHIIDAVVKTKPDLLKTIVDEHALVLVDRFKERVDDVKCDLLQTFDAILTTTVETAAPSFEQELTHQASLVRKKSAGGGLGDMAQTIVKALVKQMKNKNLKVRIAALSTLACLALSIQDKLDAHFDVVFPELKKAIEETQSFEPMLNALLVLRRLFRAHTPGTPAAFHNHVDDIKNFLVSALNHEYSKVVSEGLRVSGSFLNTLRSGEGGAIDNKFKSVAADFFTATTNKLEKTDIDIEVKSCSILSAASLVSVCHSALQPAQVKKILDIYSDRLGNELTRDAALKGLTMIATNETSSKRQSNANTALIPLGNLTGFLSAFYDLLKKTHRQLHLNTLECMEALTRRYPDQFQAHVPAIANEISPMIDEQDLQRAILALKVATNLIAISPAPQAHAQVIGMAVQLSGSELI
jgi:cullin-associated NEDD8-dissociated protein 1